MSDVGNRISSLSPEKRALLERQLLARRGDTDRDAIPCRGDDGPCALSFPQQRLWFLEQLAPGQPTYNAVVALRMRGPLDRGRLERGLRVVIDRHEALRTVFRTDGGEPRQIVLRDWSFALDERDLRTAPAVEREAEMLRHAREAARQPFDLENDLMLRVLTLQLDEEEHVVLFLEHHIAFDGWSDAQLFRELSELYAAEAEGRDPQLDELPIQYADWAIWQQAHIQGAELERLATYWRRHLAGAPPVMALPLDHERPRVQRFAGAHEQFELAPPLADAVRALARAEGATPFMVLLAAFSAVLERWSGVQDIVLGSPIANRNRVELEHLIGFFSNTFVLRLRPTGDPTFRALVRQAKEVALGAYEHQDLPFEKIVEVVKPPRDPRVNPIFQVNFRVQSSEPDILELPGLHASPFSIDIGFARFDLAVEFHVRSEQLSGYLEYNAALFERATASRLVARLGELVADALARPDAHLSELAWEPERERDGGVRGARTRK